MAPTAPDSSAQGRVCETLGNNDNKRSALKGRDKRAAIAPLITTRILWLRGLEPGVNLGGDVDSHDRYIYLHGTNREDLIGAPQSAGCVVMRNRDIIDLHDRVRDGDMILIA